MKNLLKKFIILTLTLVSIIFASCEKDLYEDTIKNNSEKIKMKDVSLSNLDIETAKKINQKISSLKSEVNKNGEGKFEYNSSLGFYIDTEDGKLIEKDGKLFFTFPMFRESQDKLENVVFASKSNGDLDAYLVKYNITPEQILTSANNDNITAQFAKFNGDQICINFISETTVYPNCDQPNGYHESTGLQCEGETKVTIIEFCSNNGGGGSDTAGSNNGGNSSNGNGTAGQSGPLGSGGAGTGVSTDIGEIITVTTPLSQQQINIRDFILSLNEEQSDWYFSQEPEVTTSIIGYITSNNFSSQSLDFIKDMINAILNNIDVDIFKNIIYGINKPCQKLIVKNTIETCSPFTELIYQTFNSTPTVGITFSNGTIPGGNPAYTNPFISGNAQNFTIKIRFDDNYLDNATDLSIVAVTLHELVHAYLMNLYLTNQLVATNAEYNTLLNAFIAFYNNQVQDTFDPLDNEIHNAMKDFMQKMANSIYNYAIANNIPNITPDYCLGLAWGTMYGTELFENTLTTQQQIDYGNIAAIEQDALPGKKGTKCN